MSDKGTSHRPSVSLLATLSSLTTHYASQTGASEVSASCRRPRPSAERSGNEVRDRQDAGLRGIKRRPVGWVIRSGVGWRAVSSLVIPPPSPPIVGGTGGERSEPTGDAYGTVRSFSRSVPFPSGSPRSGRDGPWPDRCLRREWNEGSREASGERDV